MVLGGRGGSEGWESGGREAAAEQPRAREHDDVAGNDAAPLQGGGVPALVRHGLQCQHLGMENGRDV